MSRQSAKPNAWVINVSEDIAHCNARKIRLPKLAAEIAGFNVNKPIYIKTINNSNSFTITQKYSKDASKIVPNRGGYGISVTKRLTTPTNGVVIECIRENELLVSGI